MTNIKTRLDELEEEKLKSKSCIHKPYYHANTGGLKCRKCQCLLNDYGHDMPDNIEGSKRVIFRGF